MVLEKGVLISFLNSGRVCGRCGRMVHKTRHILPLQLLAKQCDHKGGHVATNIVLTLNKCVSLKKKTLIISYHYNTYPNLDHPIGNLSRNLV